MSFLSTLLEERNMFLITAVYPPQGRSRLSAPVPNPLYGLFPHQRRVLRWVHVYMDKVFTTPGSLVHLVRQGQGPVSIRSILFRGGQA